MDVYGKWYGSWLTDNLDEVKRLKNLLASMEDKEKNGMVNGAKAGAELDNANKELREAKDSMAKLNQDCNTKKVELTEEIRQHTEDLEKLQKALETLTSMRDKVEGVSAESDAGRFNLMQVMPDQRGIANVRIALELVDMLSLSSDETEAVQSFQKMPMAMLQGQMSSRAVNEYGVQSKVIIGIFTGMNNSVTSDKNNAENELEATTKSCTDQNSDLNDEITTGKENIANFKNEKGSANENGASAAENGSDIEFRRQNKLFTEVTEAYAGEYKAIEVGVTILTKYQKNYDDSMKILNDKKQGAVVNATALLSLDELEAPIGFLELNQRSQDRVVDRLEEVAKSSGSLRIAEIAVMIQMHARQTPFQSQGTKNFLKSQGDWRVMVQKEIDGMIKALREEQKTDQESKDQCEQMAASLEAEISSEKNKGAFENLSSGEMRTSIQERKDMVSYLEETKKNLETEFENLQAERKKEAYAYKEQRQIDVNAMKGMKEAAEVLAEYMGDAKAVGFIQAMRLMRKNHLRMQRLVGGGDPYVKKKADKNYNKGPAFKKNKKLTGVMGLVHGVIDQYRMDMDDRANADDQAIAMFQEDRKNNIQERKETKAEIEEKEAEIAELRTRLQEAMAQKEAAAGRQQQREKDQADRAGTCAPIINKFDDRRNQRNSEVSALNKAKGFIQGV